LNSLLKKFIFLMLLTGIISSCHPFGSLTPEATQPTLPVIETTTYPTPTLLRPKITLEPTATQEPAAMPDSQVPVLATLVPATDAGKELVVLYGEDISRVQGISDFFERGVFCSLISV